ncbi:hypothetical protein MLD38_026441 [Melastoma candidum]|uniref:Uncharacterized protein n=1 Tax=Melastoma candidum TaxID=119954 RepID=A0ACB9P0G1_9MYRT|nr:hypothetical protein MLD38_026441 [Melastoma candidum]
MDSSFLPRTVGVSTSRYPRRVSSAIKSTRSRRVSAVLYPVSSGVVKKFRGISQGDTIDGVAAGMVGESPKTVYKDSWFDLVATNHLSLNVQAVTGIKTRKGGYEGLVEVVTGAYRSFGPGMQRNLMIAALYQAFPKPILDLARRAFHSHHFASSIRWALPESKIAREYCAAFTTIFFAWLVGPCEVREGDHNGMKEKNVVYIKKCRFLEETSCVGMCQNMCKLPSQAFIKETLGMPVNMVPNFEDMSCEMVFGQEAPPVEDDPAFKQPCYKLCNSKKKHILNCSG